MNIQKSATPAAPPYRSQFLVVVHDDTSLEGLPAAAAQACRIKDRLLVALATPCAGFTTDAAIARFAACGVEWTIVRMPVRNSTNVTRRERRLATAAKRLARRRGLAPLPAHAAAQHAA